ncbi:MAG: filamentous hemagglutinin family protein [Verrucomicrobiota bacterium]
MASSLPINDNLIGQGLLNNPDHQFLFSALKLDAGANGTAAFDPGVAASTRIGDVTVQAGAVLSAPSTAAKVGGRIALIGANVTNSGTIETPDGQTILAAGLQVGLDAHSSTDPSLRGLDVYVGAVANPQSLLDPYAGTVTLNGLISATRASVTLVGKTLDQLGAIDASTSVALNGRIDLLANYGAIGNIAFDSSNPAFGPSFLNFQTGSITLGAGSVTRVVPEFSSTETAIGTKLALSSQINLTGNLVHLANGAVIQAQSGQVAVEVGTWLTTPAASSTSPPLYQFFRSGGRIDLDAGSLIDVGGSRDVVSSVTANIVTVQLLGSELADSPLLRSSALRGATLTVDITQSGTYNGKAWIGTPLADVSGYANLVLRTVGELTTAGGSVKLDAGDAVVMRDGATINVAGGSVNYAGGVIQTSRITSNGQIFDVATATPDRVYDGIYTGSSTSQSVKWAVSNTYANPLAINGSRYQEGFVQGGNGGALEISSAAMVLDGALVGGTVVGPRQRNGVPTAAALALTFSAERLLGGLPSVYSPSAPHITFARSSSLPPLGDYAVGSDGLPLALPAARIANVVLSPTLLGSGCFGSLTLANPDGDITVGQGVTLDAGAKGVMDFEAANLTIQGRLAAAGGSLVFKTYNLSPTYIAELSLTSVVDVPPAAAGRGLFTLGAGASLDVAAKVTDERPLAFAPTSSTLVTAGGSVAITTYTADLAAGSLIDVSGGAAVSGSGKVTYGNGGSISILAGRDLNLASVTGGTLQLGGELRGFAGAAGGSLALQAQAVQIGGRVPAGSNTLWLEPGFFDQGGFSSFSLSGIGSVDSGSGQTLPGLLLAQGTQLTPTVTSLLATVGSSGGPVTLSPLIKPLGLRSPVALTLSSLGVVNDFTRVLMVRGDTMLGAGSVIDAGPRGSITVAGNTVELHGTLRSSGGTIRVSGAGKLPTLVADPPAAYTTVLLGADAVLDVAGSQLLVPDAFGRSRGAILDGGSIRISGNVVADAGSLLNVSGASGTLDLLAGETGKAVESLQDGSSGTVTTPYAISGTPTLIQSNGGTISLAGGEMLWSDATLLGQAGGSTAVGGTLQLASGGYFPVGTAATPLDANLVIRASGAVLPAGYLGSIGGQMPVDGSGVAGAGRFAVERFAAGGFANLDLAGTLRFAGPVAIEAAGRITAGTSPVMLADGAVVLNASYLALGTAFQTPMTAEEAANFNLVTLNGAQFFMPPTHGTASLAVSAALIDVGYLALRGFARADLVANGGDIRGSGTLEVAGDIRLRAGQIYAPSALSLTVAAFDYLDGAVQRQGSVTIEASGTRQLPLSAGGALNIYGSIIHQNGVLRAPFGSIQLGWDGSGTAPHDGQLANLDFATTAELVLGSASVTSVSGVDPVTGVGVVVPYGTSLDGSAWLDPSGQDISSVGVPSKSVKLSATSVVTQQGSVIDIRGGGDLFAYQWVKGLGGSTDILAAPGSFALLPGYSAGYAPYAPFSSSSSALAADPGYVNTTLRVGDAVRLDAGAGLAAGTYTLLPARYALLPGAFLVTPLSGTAVGSVGTPDGAAVVSGRRFNGLVSGLAPAPMATRFEVAPAATIASRATYNPLSADSYFKVSGGVRVPGDSGQLVLAATQAMALGGGVRSIGQAGDRGGIVDISSPVDILISDSTAAAAPGTLVLSPTLLSSFGAESLLIGGTRSSVADGSLVTVATHNLTLDNAGSPLTGPEIILVAQIALNLADHSEIVQSGTLGSAADTLVIGQSGVADSGNASLLRVSSDPAAALLRHSVSAGGATMLAVGAGARLSGGSVTLDSTSHSLLDASAIIQTSALALGSGRISLALDPAVVPGADAGLVLSSATLASLANAQALSLASYSSVDVLGAGTVGGVDASGTALIHSLTLHTAEIRGLGLAGGSAILNARQIFIDNRSAVTPGTLGLPNSGEIVFQADSIDFGGGAVVARGLASTVMTAATLMQSMESGSFGAAGNLTLNTPVWQSSQAVNYALSAGGTLQLKAAGSGTGALPAAGLGASLALSGATVAVASRVVMPGGQVSLHATAGNLTVSGAIDAGGFARDFQGQTRFTNGGQIRLQADQGLVTLTASGLLDVAAQAGGGDAGSLDIAAVSGSVSLVGTLAGSGGVAGTGGAFSLDVGKLASLAPLDRLLNAASFNASRSYRIRSGDVAVDGSARSHAYTVATDGGILTVTGTIDASGPQGGSVRLVADRSLIVSGGAHINVAAADFDAAGKGGSVVLETRGANGGGLALNANSTIDLGVHAWSGASAAAGDFQGTLLLRAPRNAANSDVALAPIDATINGASTVTVEGYRTFDVADFGGLISGGFQSLVLASGQQFLGTAGSSSASYAPLLARLTANSPALAAQLILSPGVEVVNSAAATPLPFSLSAANSSLAIPSSGGSLAFPSGTPGTSQLRSSAGATLTSTAGAVTSITANTNFAVPAGSVLTLASGGTVTYAAGSGAINVVLNPGAGFTTGSTGASGTLAVKGSSVTLNSLLTSSVALTAGSMVTFPTGTAGNNLVRSTVSGRITAPDGTLTLIHANTSVAVAAGSYVSLDSAGSLNWFSGTGGAVPIALVAGSLTTSGAVTATPPTPDITLGGPATTSLLGDWNLASARFGPNKAAGFLTLRSAGNIVLNASLTDGFTTGAYTSALLARNPLLPANAQAWSFSLVAGADLAAADTRQVVAMASLGSDSGSVKLGKNGFYALVTGGANALTATPLSASSSSGLFQVIRTGSGNIDVVAARDLQLLNNFASIYSAGTLVADPTLGGTFDTPRPDLNGSALGSLGAVQQATPAPVQYTLGGGNVSLAAGGDIVHLTRTALGALVADSSREMPVNWLDRRGYVDASTGQFGVSKYGEVASTTWWVDFTNFFEGVGALGGGNVTLHAGRDVANVDAVSATNARMPKGTPDAAALIELGGGDVTVLAGRNIDGGSYYVERGLGTLSAGASVTTNATRSPSLGTLKSPAATLDPSTWLATTLFAGKARFTVSAAKDVLLGPVANPFLLPQGYNNTYWYKTWFSTYSPASALAVVSLGGSVTLREGSSIASGTVASLAPALQTWFENEMRLTSNPPSASFYQPWLRLSESLVAPFATGFSVLPGSLAVTAFTGGIALIGNLSLAPAAAGSLELLAAGSIGGLQVSGTATGGNLTRAVWASSVINLSDANPAAVPQAADPYAYQSVGGISSVLSRQTDAAIFNSLTAMFAETGSANGTTPAKQLLHTPGQLHAADATPLRIYADADISDIELFSAKTAQVIAGRDIRDISFYLQNVAPDNVSVVAAGRDLIAYDTATAALVNSLASGNIRASNSGPRAGDIQIGGPGTLEVLAGRALDLGVGGNNPDGTGSGITSIGNARNPYQSFAGANIIAAAGIGDARSLDASQADFAAFIARFVKAGDGTAHLAELGLTQSEFDALDANAQVQLALQLFYLVLRDAGRDHNNPLRSGYRNYDAGTQAIAALFPGNSWSGGIETRARDIRTKNGGSISLLAPGGSLTLAATTIGNPLAPPGIVTEAGGHIDIFTRNNVDLGISRIFTLKGGDEIIWSSLGNIAAGSSSKTVQSAPPTRVLIDPESADVKTDLAGLATGGGIGVLASVAGVKPGNVDLIAPLGTIDAGDAGIRVSGNLNIAAAIVVNSANISAGGTSTGAAPAAPAAPSVGAISAAATTAGATNTTLEDAAKRDAAPPAPPAEVLSIISVEVLGYGGGGDAAPADAADSGDKEDNEDKPQP